MTETLTRLPPGPRGRWLPTYQLLTEPQKTFNRWAQRYGDPFLVPALNGSLVMTGRPDLIRVIFGADPSMYAAFAAETLRPMLGSGSLLLMDGAPHKRERKLVMPMFHGDRMKAYGAVIQDVALKAMQRRRHQHFCGIEMTTAISQEVIVRAVFGATTAKRTQRLLDVSQDIVRRSSPFLFFSKKTHFSMGGWSAWDRFLKSQKELYQAFDDELAARAAESERERVDILSLLSAGRYEDGTPITHEHLRDELFTFLFAGHETSAVAMAWALEHLHRHPETLEQLRHELRSAPNNEPSTLAQLPYLKAVVQETLRLNPIVTEVLRLLREPMQLGEFLVPAGHGVAAAAILTHYNPTIYPNPEQFRPERFIERSYSPFEFLPFGGGNRRCVGAAFATYEMVVVLGTLLHRCKFELSSPEPARAIRRNITMGPSSGIPMRIID